MNDWNEEEGARLAALVSYGVLDSLPEQSFDDLTEIASAICGTPVSLVSFVDSSRQWFKARKGLSLTETPRDLSFCAHTIQRGETLVVPDALLDPRFRTNALVTGDPGIRFYAGAPIVERDGKTLGTVCVIDTEPRSLSSTQIAALESLARQAVSLLEHRQMASQKAALAERAEASLERLQLALDAANLAAWYYDPVRQVIGGDDRMTALFAVKGPELPAEVWLHAVVEEDRQRVRDEFVSSLRGIPFDTQFHVEADGLRCSVHARSTVSPRHDGTFRVVGICEDVTGQTALAAELKRTAERLLIAQTVSGAITFDWDLVTDTMTWSGDFFGRPAADVTHAKDVFACVHPDDAAALSGTIQRAIATGQEYHHVYRVYWPDNSLHWVSTSGKPLGNMPGSMTSIVGVVLDVTDRKLNEETLLHTEKLAAAGRLASTISHEINNPLEAVTNLLYIVRASQTISREDRELVEQADRELARVSQVASQTLNAHRDVGRPVWIDGDKIVLEMVTLYRTRLVASGVKTRLDLQEGIRFKAHEGEVRQVLNSLVGNAFDAMRTGGMLRLRTRTTHDHKTGRKGVTISVADSGPGIAADARKRIFEAFYSTKGINGTGLGLWLSKRTLNQHGGHISFRTATGRLHGTVFRVWLPLDGPTSKHSHETP